MTACRALRSNFISRGADTYVVSFIHPYVHTYNADDDHVLEGGGGGMRGSVFLLTSYFLDCRAAPNLELGVALAQDPLALSQPPDPRAELALVGPVPARLAILVLLRRAGQRSIRAVVAGATPRERCEDGGQRLRRRRRHRRARGPLWGTFHLFPDKKVVFRAAWWVGRLSF